MGLESSHPVDVPAGYPRAFEREVRLRDGRVVDVRPILPGDAPALSAAFAAADPDTLRRRFLGAPPRVTPALLDRLTRLDYVRRFALVAADPRSGAGIGIARYEPLADGVADVAVAVDPGWRRLGLATALVALLAEAAHDRGIHAFSAVYLAENRPVATLLDHTDGAARRVISEGIAEAVVALDAGS